MNNKTNPIKKYYTEAVKHRSNSNSCCSMGETEIPTFSCYNLLPKMNQLIQKGMTVIDLGSGTGYDLIQAARLIGTEGKAFGIDFTKAMIEKAQTNIALAGLSQVEVIRANIDEVPLPNNVADVIISNCVINLHQDKRKVLKEAYRLLKPNGILLNADTIAKKPFSQKLQNNTELWCSCVSGSLTEDQYRKILVEVGFQDIKISYHKEHAINIEDQGHPVYSGLIQARKIEE